MRVIFNSFWVFHASVNWGSFTKVWAKIVSFPGLFSVFMLVLTMLWFASFSICWSDFLAKMKWFIWISKSQRTVFVSLSRTHYSLCIYRLVIWLNFRLCAIPTVSPFQPSCVCSSITFCAYFLYSLCDQCFHLNQHITCTCYSLVSNQF